MAGSVNKVILVGNLGRDPEVRNTQNGDPIVHLNLATSESWKDKNSGERREKTEWHRGVFFGRLAELAGEYLRKGSQVYIEGRLQTRKWEDQKTGQERDTTEIVANDMQMLGSRGGSGEMPSADAGDFGSKASASRSPSPAGNPGSGGDLDLDDDIPF